MEAVGVAVNLLTVIDMTAKVGLLCFQYGRDVKHAKADIDRLHTVVTNLQKTSESVQKLLQGPNGARLESSQNLATGLHLSLSQLEALEEKLKPRTSKKLMSRVGFCALQWPIQKREVDRFIQELGQQTEIISLALQADQTTVLLGVDQKIAVIDQKTVLNTLPIAEGASFDSREEEHNPTCLPETRVALLSHISKWADDPQAADIFWLNGVAGVGKSTISRTIARNFSQSSYLGASFFFKRGEADRGNLSKFFTTIASQLVRVEPSLAPHIKEAIDDDPMIFGKASREQFEQLIMLPVVIVIDALDECERDADIKFLIDGLSRATSVQSLRLRIVVTSRPELPIRLGFDALGTYQQIILHKLPPPVIEHDICVFLQHELAIIRRDYNRSVSNKQRQLPIDWPGEGDIQILVRKATPLFIFAATVCRFLADRRCGHPNELLREVLDFKTDRQEEKLDATYLPILNKMVAGLSTDQQGRVVQRFRQIVGSIVILLSPLTICALSKILGISEDDVDNQLSLLHSVLNVPTSVDAPVRLLHLSFRDFLVDPRKRGVNMFWMDEKQLHSQVAVNCLRVMSDCLRNDICSLKNPGACRSSIDERVITSRLPAEVQYACLYWADHTKQADMTVEDAGDVYTFLSIHFLHWSVLGPGKSPLTSEFLQDAGRLILANISVISSTPLQIYSSALVFTPNKSVIRRMFQHHVPEWISLTTETEDNWDPCLQILEGHTDVVTSVAFSPDSALVASASRDGSIRLWSIDGGECIQEIHGYGLWLTSVVFSPDSTLIASASGVHSNMSIWRVSTGDRIQHLDGHSGSVTSVAFSPDSTLVVLASYDFAVRLWRVGSDECVRELKGHFGLVEAAVFSPDSAFIASASYDSTVRIWKVDTGECVKVCKGHTDSVLAIAFSPTSAQLLSAGDDGAVRLWQIPSGECIQVFKGRRVRKTTTAFSPDSKMIASSPHASTVQLRCVGSGKCVQELQGHGNWVNSVGFSPDSTRLVSGSDDWSVRIWQVGSENSREVEWPGNPVVSIITSPDLKVLVLVSLYGSPQLWDVASGRYINDLHGDGDLVVFSPDSNHLASRLDDNKILLWRADTGKLNELKGHLNPVESVAFSPDSVLMASVSGNEGARLWRVDTGECVQELIDYGDSTLSVTFSADSKLVAIASDEGLRIWQISDGKNMLLQRHTRTITSVAFSPSNDILASGSYDNTVGLWWLHTGELIQLQGHGDWITSIAFSPDSALVASASGDETVRLWRIDGGECLHVVHIGVMTSQLRFEPSGALLHTDVGAISFGKGSSIGRSGYGISEDLCWITWQGNKVLWLPASYGPGRSTVAGSMVAIGRRPGGMLMMKLTVEKLLG
ncbi:hypothetical protein AUP68_16711 [Ilyonectria robusta]